MEAFIDLCIERNGDLNLNAPILNHQLSAVEAMLSRCAEGPRDAKVTAVTIIDEGGAPPSGFKVIASDRWR